ncbi:hypothetical protein BSKO_06124 [Bryopsis sp. KO-2023]|nr:hypothetical protein BSKO_06124 [Bryopsis sp. KO-2023]
MASPRTDGGASVDEEGNFATPIQSFGEGQSVVDLITPEASIFSGRTSTGDGGLSGPASVKRPYVEDLTGENSVEAKKLKIDLLGSGGLDSSVTEGLVEDGDPLQLLGQDDVVVMEREEENEALDSPVMITREKTVVPEIVNAASRSAMLPASMMNLVKDKGRSAQEVFGWSRRPQPFERPVVRPAGFVSARHGEMDAIPDIQPHAEPEIKEAKFVHVTLEGDNRSLPWSFGGGSTNPRGNESKATKEENVVPPKVAMEALMESLEQSTEEMDVAERTLNATLMRHQRISLHWMSSREGNPKVPGGILADDQGLGKTISTLAVIATKSPPPDWKSSSGKHGKEGGSSLLESPKLRGGTLIVCPMAVIKQWESEATSKIHKDAMLSVQMHHGTTRAKTAERLRDYGIVLTTYGTVLSEYPEETRKMRKKDGNSSENPIDLSGDEEEEEEEMKLKLEDGVSKKSAPKKKSKKKRGPLFDVHWYRVVLDEAQTIKNANTRGSRAVAHLAAEKRWCLSGTPIQNSIKDLFSYFRFLRFKPYCELAEFNNMRMRVQKDAEKGSKALRSLLNSILLRRTKHTCIEGEPIVNLPKRQQELIEEEMSGPERAYYEDVRQTVMKQMQHKLASGDASMFSMLLMLLKLRQAVCHSWLLEKNKHFQGVASKKQCDFVAKLPEQRRKDMKEAINNIHESCAICCDLPDQPMVTSCCHIFCFQCITSHFGSASGGEIDCCPQCGHSMKLNEVMPPAAFEEGTNSEKRKKWCDSIKKEFTPSTKINRLMKILKGVRAKNEEEQSKGKSGGKRSASDRALAGVFRKLPTPSSGTQANIAGPDKVLVFSQWTSMLDLIEIPLTKEKFKYRRLDGSMSLQKRETAIKEFRENPEVIVLLMSLKAAALGLNLTCANHVVLFDMWWNPTIEEQAIDRAHRIGQTRDVKVTRLAIKDSVEQKIIQLQEEKRSLIARTLGTDGGSANNNLAGQLTMEDLKFLFG